jgi:hypothetical protein
MERRVKKKNLSKMETIVVFRSQINIISADDANMAVKT